MFRVKSKVAFSGVPRGTEARVEREINLYRVTWELDGRDRPLVDWFDQKELELYLQEID